jgi:hypothetical protein
MIRTVKSFVTVHALRILAGVLAAVALFAVIQTIRIEGVWCSDVDAGEKPACLVRGFKQEITIIRIDLAEAEARARAEAAKHKATKQAYREAQEEAARIQAEIIEAEVARQERITDEVRASYQQRIAALRARADRLRREAEAAARGGGSAGSAYPVRVPLTGDPAPGTDEAPDCATIPAPDTLTDIRCREIAEQQATQLDALILWLERQIGVTD